MREIQKLRWARERRAEWAEHRNNWKRNPTALCALHRLVGKYVVTVLESSIVETQAQEECDKATQNWVTYAGRCRNKAKHAKIPSNWERRPVVDDRNIDNNHNDSGNSQVNLSSNQTTECGDRSTTRQGPRFNRRRDMSDGLLLTPRGSEPKEEYLNLTTGRVSRVHPGAHKIEATLVKQEGQLRTWIEKRTADTQRHVHEVLCDEAKHRAACLAVIFGARHQHISNTSATQRNDS
jgi:hypothetical protein